MQAIIDQVMTEMRAHPITLIVVLALLLWATWAQSQHASAADVAEVNAKVDRVLALQLSNLIRDLQAQQCATPEGQNKRALLRALEEAQQDYTELTNERYPVQPCAVLLADE